MFGARETEDKRWLPREDNGLDIYKLTRYIIQAVRCRQYIG